jgi:hypothetical protein
MARRRTRSRAPAQFVAEITRGLLEPGEELLGSWETRDGSAVVVLSTHRVIGYERRGVFSKSYVQSFSRPLEGLPESRNVSDPQTGGARVMLAGVAWPFDYLEGEALCAEVNHARARRARQLEPPSAPASSATHTTEREVVTREIVMVRCRFCGHLNDQVSPKCAQCGAPL